MSGGWHNVLLFLIENCIWVCLRFQSIVALTMKPWRTLFKANNLQCYVCGRKRLYNLNKNSEDAGLFDLVIFQINVSSLAGDLTTSQPLA
jgi:hypothetical protein